MKLLLIPPGEFDMGSPEGQVAWFVADGRTKSQIEQFRGMGEESALGHHGSV